MPRRMVAIFITFVIIWLITLLGGNEAESRLQMHTMNIKTASPKLFAHLIADQIQQNGFIFLNNTSIGNTINVNRQTNEIYGLDQLSDLVTSIPSYYDIDFSSLTSFDYSLGNVAGRMYTKQPNGHTYQQTK